MEVAVKVGYGRTSTQDQVAGLEAQLRDLWSVGCERIFSKQVSSVSPREQLEAALDFVRTGDTLVVTRMDRLARSTGHLLKIMETLSGKGVSLQILDLAVDTGSATGKLLLTTLGAIAEFERQLMMERQREGIAEAKAERKYKGRKPTARAKSDQVKKLKAEGFGATEIAARLGIGRASIYRVLGD